MKLAMAPTYLILVVEVYVNIALSPVIVPVPLVALTRLKNVNSIVLGYIVAGQVKIFAAAVLRRRYMRSAEQ